MSDKPPIWNVRASVVELIAAPTGRDAQQALYDRLIAAGFVLYDDSDTDTAFESEPLDPDEEAAIRAESPAADPPGPLREDRVYRQYLS